MAARRLIIVLVLLLGVSVAAAAVAPERPGTTSEPDESTTTTPPDADPVPAGQIVERELEASVEQPGAIRVAVGDQLSLDVTTQEPLEVEIDSFGVIANADPVAPAHFNLLLTEPGDAQITDAATGDLIGRLLVDPEATKPK